MPYCFPYFIIYHIIRGQHYVIKPKREWLTGVQSLAEATDFLLASCVQTSSEAHPAFYPIDTCGCFTGVKRCRGVTFTTHLHLVPRSVMSRSYTPLPLSACVAWAGQFVFLTFHGCVPASPLIPCSIKFVQGGFTERIAFEERIRVERGLLYHLILDTGLLW
jgi:hypothetical protein